jgi:IK cytokine
MLNPPLQIAEQRKYLGGDATHSILVKGLDLALLAQRKAEIEATEGKKAEDELDAILEAEHSAAPREEKASDNLPTGKKRSREEIVQQLKRQRTGASGSEAAVPQETLGSKVSYN